MKQLEVAQEINVSVRTLSSFSPERLADYGFEKVGKGKGSYYRRLDGNKSGADQEGENQAEAKRRKTIAEANLTEQRYHKERQRLFDEWTEEFYGQFAKAFAPFKNKVTSLRLDKRRTAQLNKIFSECMGDLEGRLKSISQKKNCNAFGAFL